MTDAPWATQPLDETPALGKLDMGGYQREPEKVFGPAQVGDIYRTRQGRLYVIMSVPGPSRPWRSTQYAQHIGLNPDGSFGRYSQTLLEYLEANWEKIGHVTVTFGDPEWYV